MAGNRSPTPEEFIPTLKESVEDDGKPTRLILNSPFFKILYTKGTRLMVRCCSCEVEKQCSYNSIGHLKTHLKSLHPNIHRIYEQNRWVVKNKIMNSFKKQAVVKVKSELIETNEQYQVDSSMPDTKLKGFATNEVKSVDIATTSKDANYYSCLASDEGLSDLQENEQQSEEKLKTFAGDLRTLIFKPPFFEVISNRDNKLEARCCTCDLVIRSSRGIAEQLIQHIKIYHMDIFKNYAEILDTDDDASIDSITSSCYNKNITDSQISEKSISNRVNEVVNNNKQHDVGEIEENDIPTSGKNHDQQNSNTQPSRKGRNVLVLKEPFFKIIRNIDENNKSLLVSCCTCHVVKKTTRHNASHISDHIKRIHPEIYKLYQERKRNHMEKNFFRTSANVRKSNQNQNIKNSKESNNRELSDTQLENFKVLIDRTLKKLVNHTGFYSVRTRLTKLNEDNAHDKHSANILQLKSDIENLKKQCKALRLDARRTYVNKIKLNNELERLDSLLNHRKLLIRNIEITDNNQPIKDVENLFKSTLNLDEVPIVSCTIICKPKSSGRDANTENVIIELLRPEDCNLVFNRVEKLKNTGISIEPELSPSLRERRNKLMVLRNELLNRKSDLKVFVRNATLLVNGKSFYWDDVKGLCHDCTSPEAAEISGVEYLNNLTDLDLTEIIYVLRNYDIKAC